MSRRPLRGLVTSLLLHVVLVTAALAVLPRSELLPALFVDLTASDVGERQPTAAMSTSASKPSRAPAAIRRQSTASSSTVPVVEERPQVASAPPRATVPEAPVPSSPPEPPAPERRELEPVPQRAPLPAPERPPTGPEVSPPPAALPAAAPVEPELASRSVAPADAGPARQASPAPPERAGGDPAAAAETAASETAASAASDSVAVGHDRTGREAHDDASDASPSEQELSRGPTGEGGEALPGVYRDYLAGLRQRIHEALRYPPAARRRGLTGAVTIELTVLPSGVISDVKVVHSSSHSLLDDAAVETVQELRAQRFPPNVPARPLRVRLPVVFQLE